MTQGRSGSLHMLLCLQTHLASWQEQRLLILMVVMHLPGREEEDDGDREPSSLMEVDGWLSLRVPTSALAPLLCLRQRLSTCFAAKVSHYASQVTWCWSVS